MLKHKARVVLLSASLLLAGIQGASPVMAQDHERPHADAPRAQAPQGGRPGPGPGAGAARPGIGEGLINEGNPTKRKKIY